MSLLDRIDSPADIRNYSIEELRQLCSEIREYMIDCCATNPGHLGSSLGAVELIVGFHYVYNSPYDKIVFDVGHQAYAHKILTGRKDIFRKNRKKDGISGFTKKDESEYDAFGAGHSSTSISAALGIASAAMMMGLKEKVVALIGDGALSGGLAFEGLNNAAATKSNILIILNDNDMSIAKNVGSLNKYLVNITTSKSYNTLRYNAYKFLRRFHLITESHRGAILRFNNSLKSLISRQQNIFEGLNIRYFGPYDGHDVVRLVRVLSDIKDMDGPRILHLRTVKGKGFEPAEKNPCLWHAPGKFDKTTGELIRSKDDGRLKYQDVFGKTLVELADKNPLIVGITAAMSTGCSMTFMQQKYPQRTFDVGISEGHAVTFSGGLAKDGARPFCCIYSSFLQRGFDEIIHDVAIQNLPVVFCIDRAGLVGEDGVTHHGVFDLAYLRDIPNMTIASPIDEHDLRNLMFTAQKRNSGPFAIRYPRGKSEHADWHNEMQELPIGKGKKLKDGNDIAVLTIGPIGNIAAEAVKEVEGKGVNAAHYDMVFLKPLDTGILQEVAGHFSKAVTIEDGTTTGGLGTAVAEWFATNAPHVAVRKIGVPDHFIKQGTVAQLYALCGMDKNSIVTSIIEFSNKDLQS